LYELHTHKAVHKTKDFLQFVSLTELTIHFSHIIHPDISGIELQLFCLQKNSRPTAAKAFLFISVSET